MNMKCVFCGHEFQDTPVEGSAHCPNCGEFFNIVKESYPGGECPDCGQTIPDTAVEGEECSNCGHVFCSERPNDEPNDSMDGDAASALASAGFGTDEDYEHNSFDEGGFGEE